MRAEPEINERIEELKERILDSSTKSHIRENCVNQMEALQWVLKSDDDAIKSRLKKIGISGGTVEVDNDAGIDADSGKKTKTK